MNKVLILTLALLSQTGMIEAQSSSDSDTEMSSILIIAPRTGLTLFIDDSLIGYVTNDTLSIPAGFHQLSVSDGKSDVWSATDWTWSGELEPDSVYLFKVKIERFTIFNTIPFGAKVVIDGIQVGTTPFILSSMESAVEIVMANYMPVRIEPSELSGKNIMTIVLVQESPVMTSESSGMKPEIKSAGGSMITRSAYLLTAASGIAAVWSKFEADKAFNALPMAFDPEDIAYYENRAKKYDDLAALSFATFQIGFLYSIYRAIRN